MHLLICAFDHATYFHLPERTVEPLTWQPGEIVVLEDKLAGEVGCATKSVPPFNLAFVSRLNYLSLVLLTANTLFKYRTKTSKLWQTREILAFHCCPTLTVAAKFRYRPPSSSLFPVGHRGRLDKNQLRDPKPLPAP